jgi:hypothetical protein
VKCEGSDLLLFITALPNTKLCAWGEEDSGGQCASEPNPKPKPKPEPSSADVAEGGV